MNDYLVLIVVATSFMLIALIYQVGRIVESFSYIKGENVNGTTKENKLIGNLFALLVFGFIVASIWTYFSWEHMFLPESASEEGLLIEDMIQTTFIVTGLVFLLTQAALGLFAFQYKHNKARKALFFPHQNKLEIIWTVVPSIVLSVVIIQGAVAWYDIQTDIEEDAVQIEVTARQFGWLFRYPGPDGKLGERKFKLIDDGNNQLGIDFSQSDSHDDIMSSELIMPVDTPVLFIIRSRDVLHGFYLPHFKMKMDAVPGVPTYLRVTPRFTTEEMREREENPEFNFELACAEMCGNGHFNMQAGIVVKEAKDFDAWIKEQIANNKTYYSLYK